MLIDQYPYEDVFARVPELANHTDPVLHHLDHLLDDDMLYSQVRSNLGTRSRLTLVYGGLKWVLPQVMGRRLGRFDRGAH